MNKKLVRGSLAGVAVVALAAGGGTFAAWSDFDTLDNNTAGADHLVLGVDRSGSQSINKMNLAPGHTSAKQFVVSSRDGDTVPLATLDVALVDLVGEENGCMGNSEVLDDPDCDNGLADNQGEFIDEAEIRFYASVPKTDAATACSSNTGPAVSGWIKLSDAPSASLGDLGPGQVRCVLAEVRMPLGGADQNAAQGDSASFDLRFDLKQKTA